MRLLTLLRTLGADDSVFFGGGGGPLVLPLEDWGVGCDDDKVIR